MTENPIYHPLRRPCDDPLLNFAANRGKWRRDVFTFPLRKNGVATAIQRKKSIYDMFPPEETKRLLKLFGITAPPPLTQKEIDDEMARQKWERYEKHKRAEKLAAKKAGKIDGWRGKEWVVTISDAEREKAKAKNK